MFFFEKGNQTTFVNWGLVGRSAVARPALNYQKFFASFLQKRRFFPSLVFLALFTLSACVHKQPVAIVPPMPPLDRIAAVVRDEIAQSHIPGAVVLVGHRGQITYRAAFGSTGNNALQPNDIFDLASLTKSVATTIAVMQLVEQNRLQLDAPVAFYWPAFGAHGKQDITLRQLLTHTSGLRPDIAAENWSGEAAALQLIVRDHPIHPPGSAFLYSDLNFIVLGALVEKISGQSLDQYAAQHIFAPLGMRDTGFRPDAALRPRIVPTDDVQAGRVQDPTAARMGGVAGHAGVFSTADDLARLAKALLNGGSLDGVRILRPATVALMIQPEMLPGGVRRGLGFDVASEYADGFAPYFGPRSFGHTGYTGTALWIDPDTGTFLVILSSRLYPNDHGTALPLRRRIAQLVGEQYRPPMLPGITVLEDQQFAPLVGKRVAILTNQTGQDLAGRRDIDVLAAAPGVTLAKIFTPEHGFYANREGRIESGVDTATGVQIISLYGTNLHPSAPMLAGLDAVVIDLQDAGVRFYTYPSTVAYMMQAAARSGVKVILLDRPDPINASVVQGPMLDPGLLSFAGYFPMPLRPGMTMGELATMFNTENHLGADLAVIPMQGYVRDSWYDQTGLDWINPSPNLRSLTEATLYPGVGMVEAANVSVGRGTATPFEILGAPWIDGAVLTRYLTNQAIPGVAFSPVWFTPQTDAYRGQLCHGVQITLLDRDRLDDGKLGLELLHALQYLYGAQFHGAATAGMVGSRALVAGQGAEADGVDKFMPIRNRYLIYQEK